MNHCSMDKSAAVVHVFGLLWLDFPMENFAGETQGIPITILLQVKLETQTKAILRFHSSEICLHNQGPTSLGPTITASSHLVPWRHRCKIKHTEIFKQG